MATALSKGDTSRAEHELEEYYWRRTNVAWPSGQKKATVTTAADDAVKGRVQGGLVIAWHTFPDNQFDWHYNETLVTSGLAHKLEW